MFSAKAPIAEMQISVKIDGGVVLFKNLIVHFLRMINCYICI